MKKLTILPIAAELTDTLDYNTLSKLMGNLESHSLEFNNWSESFPCGLKLAIPKSILSYNMMSLKNNCVANIQKPIKTYGRIAVWSFLFRLMAVNIITILSLI